MSERGAQGVSNIRSAKIFRVNIPAIVKDVIW